MEESELEPSVPEVQPKKSNPIIFIIIIIIFLGVTGYFVYQNYQLKQKSSPSELSSQPIASPVSKITPTPVPESNTVKEPYTENTNIPNQKKYTNPELGISFLHLTQDNLNPSAKFKTKEIGNKVYVYQENYGYSGGQYIEIFQKNPTTALEETIKEMFLENYPEDKCLATIEKALENYPANYIQANIKVPGESADMGEMSAKWNECPNPYTRTNGRSYFLMDKNHPNKFAFFSIGQYAIMADSNKNLPWEVTITFLD